ncbi:hypothetical protein VNO80_10651 [Phaseolus coccineus]|uniref:Uncharacterized protein n=1 Tax=Phaseolus coccineus TaxID=3886 RepID=A0AAN9NDS9_PHACN
MIGNPLIPFVADFCSFFSAAFVFSCHILFLFSINNMDLRLNFLTFEVSMEINASDTHEWGYRKRIDEQ